MLAAAGNSGKSTSIVFFLFFSLCVSFLVSLLLSTGSAPRTDDSLVSRVVDYRENGAIASAGRNFATASSPSQHSPVDLNHVAKIYDPSLLSHYCLSVCPSLRENRCCCTVPFPMYHSMYTFAVDAAILQESSKNGKSTRRISLFLLASPIHPLFSASHLHLYL